MNEMKRNEKNFTFQTSSTTVLLIIFHLLLCDFTPAVIAHGSNPRAELARLAKSYHKPEQIHIAFGPQTNTVVVMWSSVSNEASTVEFSNDPNSIKRVNAKNIKLSEHSEEAKKFIFRAELPGLTPGSHYSYRIISGIAARGVKSELFTFSVPHDDPKKIQPQTFMVLADMGLITKALQFVVHEAVNTKYDAVFHIGDFAYNLGSRGGSVGDQFMNKIQKFTSIVPYMTTPGDHERFNNFYHYKHRFSMPGTEWPMKEGELFYSINVGLVHFISINTDGLLGSKEVKEKQLAWLKKDLAQASKARAQFPWIIVMGHKPMYCSRSVMEQECDKEFSGIRESLEDLFFEYGVDLFLSGHKHCYERSWPMYKGKIFQKSNVNPTAPIYLVIGALGYEYLLDGQLSKPVWLAASMSKEGKELYGRLKIVNGSHLVWSVRAAYTNEEVDNIQLIQSHHGSFGQPGQAALEKLKLSMSENAMSSNQLAPVPFTIIDEPRKDVFYRLGVDRKAVILMGVFSLSLFLFLFLRHSKVRSTLRICV